MKNVLAVIGCDCSGYQVHDLSIDEHLLILDEYQP